MNTVSTPVRTSRSVSEGIHSARRIQHHLHRVDTSQMPEGSGVSVGGCCTQDCNQGRTCPNNRSTTNSTTSAAQSNMETAWRWLRQPTWPATLAETLLNPIRARLVSTYANQIERSHQRLQIANRTDRKLAAAGDGLVE
jgi:hypothetical protein